MSPVSPVRSPISPMPHPLSLQLLAREPFPPIPSKPCIRTQQTGIPPQPPPPDNFAQIFWNEITDFIEQHPNPKHNLLDPSIISSSNWTAFIAYVALHLFLAAWSAALVINEDGCWSRYQSTLSAIAVFLCQVTPEAVKCIDWESARLLNECDRLLVVPQEWFERSNRPSNIHVDDIIYRTDCDPIYDAVEWLTPNFIRAQALAFYRRPWFLWPLTAKESRPVDFTVNTHNSASWFALTSLYEPSLLERFHQDQDQDDQQESQYTGGCVLCEEHQFLLDEDVDVDDDGYDHESD